MEQSNEQLMLDDVRIQATIKQLCLRIGERFPGSSLSEVSQRVLDLSEQTREILVWISTPNYPLRFGIVGVIVVLAVVLVVSVCRMDLNASWVNVSDFVQMTDAAASQLVLIGAGVVSLVTIENRRKRQRVITAVNKLRCLAHIVDAHQLTKDPEGLTTLKAATIHSPKRDLSSYDLGRYLDYCTELLSLIGKLGFLYVQDFHDPAATSAVNDLESLTTGLSRKIWQKIMMIRF